MNENTALAGAAAVVYSFGLIFPESGLRGSAITEKQQRYHFADGLRGLFSMVVLFFHVFFVFFDKSMPSYRNFGMMFDGTTAVHVFFVLSGFSLSIAYLSAIEAGRPDALTIIKRMAAARYFRLAIPCLCACLLMYAIMASGQNYFAKIPDSQKIEWWGWAYREQSVSLVQTLRFALYDIFLPAPFVPVIAYSGTYLITNLWTMPIEFIGSLVVFIYCVAVGGSPLRLFIAIGLTLVLALANSHYALFFAGIVVAEIFIRFKDAEPPTWLNATMAGGVALMFFLWSPDRFKTQVLVCLLFVLLAALSPWTRSFFGAAPFRYLGRISFALYLVHMPVIVSLQSWLFLSYGNMWAAGCAAIAASFLAAHFFAYIDQFAIRLSHRAGRALT